MDILNDLDINRIPLGNPDFSAIRDKNKIYIDKTELIYRIAIQDMPIFFSRPRRFGKSLLINTIHSLFKDGLKYFHGLRLEKKWKDKKYRVVHLDFSGMASKKPEQLKFALGETLLFEFNLNNTISLYNGSRLREPDRILDEIVRNIDNNSVVLLVDEYDAPLTHHIENPDELREIISILSDFYATIKQYTGKFRLIFITGVTKASHVSIFSAFNNLIDLSLDDEFNNLLGFTRDNLEEYLDGYIGNAGKILKVDKSYIYKNLEKYYDGYQFSLGSTVRVYSPWSLLSFCRKPKNGFCNYWFELGGTPAIIINYLKINSGFDLLDYNKREILVTENDLSNKYEITDIPRDILLYQTGYYSIRTVDSGIARLVKANSEVEESLCRIYLLSNNLEPKDELKEKMLDLSEAIDNRDLIKIIDIFNRILNECVSSLSNIFMDERSIRDIIYAALTNIPSLQKIKEHDSASGRSDLEILTKKTCMIVEFKRSYSGRSPSAALKSAIAQIEENKYGISFSMDREMYRVAMVVSTSDKSILPDFSREIL